MSDLENNPNDEVVGDDLFGDDGEEDLDILAQASSRASSLPEERERLLDEDDEEKLQELDEELDEMVDDDEGMDDDDAEAGSQRQHVIKKNVVADLRLYRHRFPKTKDQTLQVMRVPEFLRFIPEEYDPSTYEPTESEIENARSNTNKQEAVRWKRDPVTGTPVSNALLYRWSDGSVSIGVNGEHYDVQSKGLAPRPGQPYKETDDAHMYAASAELRSDVLVVFGHLTEQYTVLPIGSDKDDALSKLAERMATAAQGRQTDMVVKVTGNGDPELLRKQVEAADRELARAQRRRENAEMKLAAGSSGGGGGGALGDRRGARGGLSAGGLEGSGGFGRKRGAPGGGGARGVGSRRKRQKADYDSEEDRMGGDIRRMEEYDRDGFVVSSDEEAEEDEDVDGMDDDDDDGEEEEEEEEAEGEDDDDMHDGAARAGASKATRRKSPSPHDDGKGADAARSKRRRVIDDDDDE